MATAAPVIPYKNFRFRILFGTQVVAMVSKVTGLKRTAEVLSHREGNDVSTPRHAPGRTSFSAITLDRGVTTDTAFEDWANKVFNHRADEGISLTEYKKDITIEVLNMQGVTIRRYNVFRAWVSEYTAQSDLDSNANAILLESVVIQNEGWERDKDLSLPDPANEQ